MRVKLNKWQYEVANDPHRFKVICAGRRSGKSVLSRMMILQWALQNQGLYWIVSPTYQQGKDIHWMQGYKSELPPRLVKQWNDADLMVTLTNGSVIQLKSAENPDRLKGVKLRGLIVDEIAAMRNWGWIWQEALRPTLTDYEAPAIFISTPKGFNHFYDLFILSDDTYKSWRFTSYDNPYIPKSEIDQAKRELTEDTFAQEYMADFRKYTGLVYKEFERDIHVIPPFVLPDIYTIYRGFDFGSTNPTCCLWVAVDSDDTWFVVDEHYTAGQTIDYHAGRINASPLSTRVTASYGDPSGAQWISEFAQRGVFITPATKEAGSSSASWVNAGIEKIANKLRTLPGRVVPNVASTHERGLPSLFVFDTCQSLIHEFETYRWREKSVSQATDINEPDVPEKANDHALDALRYVAVSMGHQSPRDSALYGRDYEFINKTDETKTFRIGR